MATKKAKKEVSADVKPVGNGVVIGPRVTEKAAYASERNVFVFNVAMDANKIQIKQAIKELYKVTPIKIAIVVTKPEVVVFRGHLGKKSAFKKAYVTLKKGDTIDLN